MARGKASASLVLVRMAGLCCALSAPLAAWADAGPDLPPISFYDTPYALDSGPVGHDGNGDEPQVVYSEVVSVPGSPFLRLRFAQALLAGDAAQENATRLVITSLKDGEVQTLNPETIRDWSNGTAVFNGDTVFVELVAYKGVGQSRIVLGTVTAGTPPVAQETICGTTDDRTLSFDNRAARHFPIGCTSWMINDFNTGFLTAGHCLTDGSDVMQFEVPLSTSGGAMVSPPVDRQYPVHGPSVQQRETVIGDDWGYFGVLPNNLGFTPFQTYGTRHTLSATAPAVSGQSIRITGYGTVDPPVSNTWNLVQKTHSGPYFDLVGNRLEYRTDTTGGNSGSAIQNLSTGQAIGIHTNAGCSTASASANSGTNIGNSLLQAALNAPRGVLLSGDAATSGSVYISTDRVNNFGTLNTSTGAFGRRDVIDVPFQQGLAYNPRIGLFYAINSDLTLTTISVFGTTTTIGQVTSGFGTINGLAYDYRTNTLYGMVQSSGRLVRINLQTMTAISIGIGGGTVGGIDFDPFNNVLYGIDDSGGASKLVTINTTTGLQTVVGNLGTGIADCNGLAYSPNDEALFTVNAATGQLLRVSTSTGAATVIGPSSGLFGASFGMSAVYGAGLATVAAPNPIISNLNTAAASGTSFEPSAFTQFKAAGFTMPAGQGYMLNTAELGLTSITGTPNQTMNLRLGSATSIFTLGSLTPPSTYAAGVNTFTNDVGIRLSPNSQYWLRVNQPTTPTGGFVWEASSPSTTPTGIATSNQFNFNGSSDSSFRNRLRISGRPIIASNLNLPVGSGTFISTTQEKETAFTMPAGQDYLFDGAQVSLRDITVTNGPSFEIWGGSSAPSAPIAVLSFPGSVSADDEYVYTREQPLRLGANQKYWLRAEAVAGTYNWASTDPETAVTGVATASGNLFGGNPSSTFNRYGVFGLPIIVSNAQVADAPLGSGTTINGLNTKSVGFTIPAGRGVDLYGVQLTLDIDAGAVPVVTVWSGGAQPTTQLVTLVNPTSLPSGRREHQFFAPEKLRLLPGSRYFVRVGTSAGAMDWPGTAPQTLPTGLGTSVSYLFGSGSSSTFNRISILGPIGPVCPADFNGDGFVDDADFVLFTQQYAVFICSAPGMPLGCSADLNNDGFVDDTDFVFFTQAYEQFDCP